MKRLIWYSILALCSLLLLSQATLAQESVFRMATFEPDSLDPALGGPGYQEYVNLYEPLVDAFDPTGEVKPLAAESWEVSEDGTVYTFKLRPGLMWSDGEPLTMNHYRDAWIRQLDPATAAYAPEEFYPILNAQAFNQGEITDPNMVGIQVLDDLTLQVTLESATPFFLYSVGANAYYPVRLDIIAEYGNSWMEADNFVGNGPYMLESWQHDQRMVFVKNSYYEGIWKDSRNVDRIEYTLLQDPWNTAVAGYEAGELDVSIVPATDIDRVRNDPELSQELVSASIAGAVIMVFDTKNGAAADIRVRQALSMAIDYDVLANAVLRGAYEPATSFSPPQLSSHDADSWSGTDVERGRKLLAEAGYPDGAGFPAFTLAYWSQERESLIAQALQAMWKQTLNIDVNLQTYEVAAMRDYRLSRATEPFDAYLALNWAGIADPQQFHNTQLDPEGNGRYSRYGNPEYVKLIRAAIYEPDPAERQKMYQAAEAIVNRDVPILSLVYEARSWLVKPYVENFTNSLTSISETMRAANPPGLKVNR